MTGVQVLQLVDHRLKKTKNGLKHQHWENGSPVLVVLVVDEHERVPWGHKHIIR